MPSWLVELQGEVADDAGEGQGVTPDWLADLAEPAQAEEQAARPEPFVDASWLNDPAGETPQAEAAEQDEQQSTTSRVKMPVGATDWLRSIGHDPDARSEPLSEPLSSMEDQSGVPEWLRDLTADEVARGIEAEAPDSQPRFDPAAPGWLADDTPTPDASTVSANFKGSPGDETAEEIPDWLQHVAGANEVRQPRAEQGPPADLAGSAEMPAWLRDLGEGEAVAEAPAAEDEPAWLRDAALRPPTDRLAGEEIDVPAWLRNADEPAPAAPPPWPAAVDQPAAEPAGDDEMPSWLREAAPSADQPTGAVAPASSPRDEPPAWLQEPPPSPLGLRASNEADEAPAWLREAEVGPPAGAAPAEADEVPAWLREAEVSPPPQPAQDEEIPGWLVAGAAAAGAAALAQPRGDDDDAPSWLRDIEQTPPPPPPDNAPAWLQGEAPASPDPTWLREALDEPAATPPAADVPSWLQAEPAPPPPAPPAGADLPPWLVADQAPPVPPAPGAPADPGLPSWLRGVADEPPPVSTGARAAAPPPRRAVPSAEQGESHSFLSGAELPSWLRVPEPERPADPAEGQALDWLRRLGGPDQEEESQGAAVAAVAPQRPEYRRTAEQVAAIGLLQQISRSPYPEPAAPAAPAPRTRWQRIGLDRVLYGLLALALLLGILLPMLTTPFQTASPAAPGAAELGALLDNLGSEDVVLVAYEWGAQRSGELRPLEQAVTSRLIANRAKMILVSTDLQGTLLSFDLVGPLRAAGYNTENGVSFGGRDYVLLGYKPGGELALRSLAQDLRGELRSDFDGQDATQGLVANNPDGTPRFSGISDLSMILVLADQPQDVQAWMEQVNPSARGVPIVFLLPQEAQPQAQPYLRMPNVYHLAGQQGALAMLASDPAVDTTALARQTGQLWYSVTAFLLLLAGGAIAAIVARGRSARGGAA